MTRGASNRPDVSDGPLEVLLVSRCLPEPMLSGDRVILNHLTRELRERGHILDLLAFRLDQEPGDAIASGGRFRHVEVVRERSRSALDYLLRLARPFPDSARQCWNPGMWQAIDGRQSRHRYHLVHFFGGIQVYEFRNLVRRTLPTLIVPYESFSRQLEIDRLAAAGWPDRFHLWARLLAARRFEGTVFRGFGRVVLVTGEDMRYLRRLSPDLPAAVIPNGVDSRHFHPAAEHARKPALVFVGNQAYPPNAEAAIRLVTEILPRVREQVPQATALIVGPNAPEELVGRSGPEVEVTGWVPDIRPMLWSAACFVSPLSLGTGIRNKILEAMATGLPVVATPLSCEGLRAVDGENAIMGRSADDLAAAAVRILLDRDLGRRIGEGGRRLVTRDHTWGQVAAQYEALYRGLIAEAPRVAGSPEP